MSVVTTNKDIREQKSDLARQLTQQQKESARLRLAFAETGAQEDSMRLARSVTLRLS